MRLWLLYLRSRFAFPALAGLLVIAGFGWAVGNRWGSQSDLFLIATVTVPLAAAVVICVTIDSPFGEVERSLSRPLVSMRFSQLAGLLIIAAVALAITATAWPGDNVEWRFVRNLLGLTGVGLLFVRVLGGRLSWASPLGFATLALFQNGAAAGTAPGWAWVVQPAPREAAAVIALVLLVSGLGLAARFGARVADGSDEH
ncbi:MAG TPA: hypothetical protein VFV93_02760 [Thermomicrobiales bacterium]|nr:hypothetical protein [Thermomicrobiales bacterium]